MLDMTDMIHLCAEMTAGSLPALMDSSRHITVSMVERITNVQGRLALSTELQAVAKQLGLLAS